MVSRTRNPERDREPWGQVAVMTPVASVTMSTAPRAIRYQTNGIRVFVATNRSSQAIDAYATTKATTIPSPI